MEFGYVAAETGCALLRTNSKAINIRSQRDIRNSFQTG
jgi:hypothetical protein